MKTIQFTDEEQIIHRLILESMFVEELGLFRGKIGIALFFYIYGQKKKNKIYEDFGGDLLDDIWQKMHNQMEISLSSGLCGIGWTVEYLIQNCFVEGDSSDICLEIDEMLVSKDIRRITDYTLNSGLEGYLHYILARIRGSIIKNTSMPFDEMYMDNLYILLKRIQTGNPSQKLKQLIDDILNFRSTDRVSYQFDLDIFISQNTKNLDVDVLTKPLGLIEGVSGLLLSKLI